MRRERFFEFRPEREAVDGKEAKDWFHLGQVELQERRYWDSFLNRSLRTSNGQENEEDAEEHIFDFADWFGLVMFLPERGARHLTLRLQRGYARAWVVTRIMH
jgi:hypothetical protein